MGQNNATVKEVREDKKVYYPINSIDQQAYVERLPIKQHRVKGIYGYDKDNLYPQKIISIKERSWALTSATKTYSDFISGDGFENEQLNSLVVNSENENLYDILRLVSNQKSILGIAIHVNYTIEGIVSEVNAIDFENLRVTIPTEKEKSKLVYCKDWSKPYKNEFIYYNFFNPLTVKEEIIKAGGIENYNGQILYFTGTNKIYPLATFDACLDQGQYQAETGLYSLRNVQNDFSASGVIRYPFNLENQESFQEAKLNIQNNATGANNRGRIIFVPQIPDVAPAAKIFESFEKNNVDNLFTLQNKEAREAIFSVFRQPAILNAISESGMFNQQSLQDAFVFYNSIVEQDRKEVESILNYLFSFSIWAEQAKEIKILPKQLIKNEGDGKEETTEINIEENGTE